MYRVKFYSKLDLSAGYYLLMAENILNKFDSAKNNYTINEIIEFYNIILYIDDELFLKSWTKEYIQKVKDIIKEYKKIIGSYLGNICDENILMLFNDVEVDYKDNFWELIEKYKIYNRVSQNEFVRLLNNKNAYLFQILKNKKLVEYYGEIISENLLEDEKNAELILNTYEIEHTTPRDNIYLPVQFTNADKESLILNYIRSSNPNVNYLRIIVNIQSRKDFIEISDRTRLEAKRRIKVEEKKLFNEKSGIMTSIGVRFCEEQVDPVKRQFDRQNSKYTYSLKWLQENMDYNTLLNNFIYLFEYVDFQMRVTLVSKESELGIFEKHLFLHSKKSYITGAAFESKNALSNLQIIGYYQQLERFDVRLEEIIEWFFKDYLLNEFSISDCRIKIPSKDSSYLEKCRAILPEMESALKQYGLFIEDGKIDHELLQISSSHLLFRDCKSLINKKYVYANEGDFKIVVFYFFSDQCMLSYVERIENKYKNFYDLINNESIKMDDYLERYKFELNWLIEHEYIKISDMGYLEIVNPMQLLIFKDLNNNKVMNYWRYPYKYRQEIEILVEQGFLRFEKALFSKPEQDYLNYHLNKSDFCNSLDLRNMYSHGTQPNNDSDEEIHRINYMIFLKLFIIIIIKINDDLCIADYSDYKSTS